MLLEWFLRKMNGISFVILIVYMVSQGAKGLSVLMCIAKSSDQYVDGFTVCWSFKRFLLEVDLPKEYILI